MVDLGDKLKQLRIDKGFSQAELARRVGITKSMISSYENSMRLPSYDVLLKTARCFHVSTDYLLGITSKRMLDVSDLTDRQAEIISRLIDEFRGQE